MAKLDISVNLTHQQKMAIVELLKGSNDEVAGKAAGVSRQTVNSWKLHHPEFILEYRKHSNAITAAILVSWQDKMKEATNYALDAVTASCKAGDVSTARWLLDKVTVLPESTTEAYKGITDKPKTLSEDLDLIIEEVAVRDVEKALEGSDAFVNMLHRDNLIVKTVKDMKAEYANLY